jgi:2-desacetyl-2-hydroxyethyl bacteriochlorophyllide A dehydrogenase
MNRQSLYFTAPGRVEVVNEEVPTLLPGQVLVESLLSAISPGTELLFYRGLFPGHIPVDESITALNQTAAYPLKYGYSLVGRVIATGSAIDPTWHNQLVFAFHPHESHFTAGVSEVIRVPDEISPEDAVLLPNMETALNFVMDGAPLVGEHAVIFGQGIVGLLTTAVLAQFPLSSLVTLDHWANRRQAALEMGAQASIDPQEIKRLKSLQPHGADLVFELSGSPAVLEQAIDTCAYAGRVVIGSWYGRKKAELDLGGRFHRSRIRLISSQVSTIAPELSGRWTKERRFNLAWDMLRKIRPSQLVTQRIPIQRAASAYELLEKHPDQSIQILFTYQQDDLLPA